MTPGLPARHAARVLLIDEQDRLLLFRSRARSDGVRFWFPIGGEVDPGETHAEAAVREAFEETGLRGLELGPAVFWRRFDFHWEGYHFDAQELWFLSRVRHFDPVFGGMEKGEEDAITGCRWLSREDLEGVQAGGDRLTPANLLTFLPGLLAGDLPDQPISVGE